MESWKHLRVEQICLDPLFGFLGFYSPTVSPVDGSNISVYICVRFSFDLVQNTYLDGSNVTRSGRYIKKRTHVHSRKKSE